MAVSRGNSRRSVTSFRSIVSECCAVASPARESRLIFTATIVVAAPFAAAQASGSRPGYPFGLIILASLVLCIFVLGMVVTAQRTRISALRERCADADKRSARELTELQHQLAGADARAAGLRSLLVLLSKPDRPDTAPHAFEAFLASLRQALPGFEVGLAADGTPTPDTPATATHPLSCDCELRGTLWISRTDGSPPSPDDRQLLAAFASSLAGFCDVSLRQRRAAQVMASLREMEMQSRKLLDFIPVPIWVYSIDTLAFIRVNQAAVERYGYSRAEWAEMTIGDIRPPEDLTAMHEMQSRIRAQSQPFRYTCRHRTRSGEVIWVDLVNRPAPFISADARLVIGFDVTPRENERRTLANRTTELAKKNEQLDRFAAIAGHDLQEPLRMISSFATLLEGRLGTRLNERERSYFAFITDGAHRMKRLLDDLLQYSRAGSRALRVAPVDSARAVRLAMSHLRLEIEQQNAVIEVGSMPRVAADESLLVMVFQNLIANSIRYRSERPVRIMIDAERVNDMWRFCVSDNGVGIPPELRREVFEMFRRGSPRPGEVKGSGLGLSICQRIIERLCGMIWLEPGDQSAGLRAYFTLPAVSDEALPVSLDSPGMLEFKTPLEPDALSPVSPPGSERST
ncbi:MAG: PAS domain S-box protein [Tepidisphaera sp.]|nr:PAS domain S-box protein [Tepidisphaera sp.]